MNELRDDQLPRNAGEGSGVIPLPAASIILLRGNPFEVLLLRRTEASTFVPGSWIFPGGALDESDRQLAANGGATDEISIMKVCAIRETLEECGIWLGGDIGEDPRQLREKLAAEGDALLAHSEEVVGSLPSLFLTSRWITPEAMPKRYDTFFFVAEVAAGTTASPDGVEATDAIWIAPDNALQQHRRRELPLLFPTIRNLEALLPFRTVDELRAARSERSIEITRPVMIVENGKKRIVIPGES